MFKKLLLVSCVSLILNSSYANTSNLNSYVFDKNKVEVVNIHGEISDKTTQDVETHLKLAEKAHKPLFLDINSPGGEIDSMLDIVALLRTSSVPTIAYGHTMIASCATFIFSEANIRIIRPATSYISHYGGILYTSQITDQLLSQIIQLRLSIQKTLETLYSEESGLSIKFIKTTILDVDKDIFSSPSRVIQFNLADQEAYVVVK